MARVSDEEILKAVDSISHKKTFVDKCHSIDVVLLIKSLLDRERADSLEERLERLRIMAMNSEAIVSLCPEDDGTWFVYYISNEGHETSYPGDSPSEAVDAALEEMGK